MRYAMLLKAHANVRYAQSLQKLGLAELNCTLRARGLEGPARLEETAGETFLAFDAEAMTDECWRDLSALSSICLAGELRAEGLRVLPRSRERYLPEELPHLLKYKGKTNADFTALLLRVARCASDFAAAAGPLTVLDPLCGKATTLFCALCRGDNAVGLDVDGKALGEADQLLGRCLELHKLKHKREQDSLTLPGGGGARRVTYAAADTAEHWKAGDARRLSLICADARRLGDAVRPSSCHVIAADLPYGVQHAPREGRGMSSLEALVDAVMPGCAKALKPGGAAAFAFNVNTVSRASIAASAERAGLSPLASPPYDDFSHWVEQAVTRDVVVARKERK